VARILIADDDTIVTEIVSQAFRRNGHTVTTAHDGRQALDHLAQQHADIIILDWSMPGMTGQETLRNLRQSRDHTGVPVLVLTGEDATTHMLAALIEGADGFIAKVCAPDVLVHRAESLLIERHGTAAGGANAGKR
jgi:DNA-binding response OmpR family regulator